MTLFAAHRTFLTWVRLRVKKFKKGGSLGMRITKNDLILMSRRILNMDKYRTEPRTSSEEVGFDQAVLILEYFGMEE